MFGLPFQDLMLALISIILVVLLILMIMMLYILRNIARVLEDMHTKNESAWKDMLAEIKESSRMLALEIRTWVLKGGGK